MNTEQSVLARFICSSQRWTQCPPPDRPEVAFIGRSNVGKSSLINMLTQQEGLAKVSATPGKTQLINHFLINEKWYLVDLPGYGFAQVPKLIREQFESMIRDYILHRENLYCLFVLLDARHEPLANDLSFIQWLGENDIPLALVFTKSDKVGTQKRATILDSYKSTLSETWEALPPFFFTSAVRKEGRDELLKYIRSFI
ncbi:MAG: YihA family ribosome biogenesis GTP-binding protein [Bacteroidia bacterium]|jgi:ribosome biogenesis GTP-binding protein ysxC|nr:YihA family ribosome biogenesis GTP-binding protein [Bacteroidia bacterium]